MAATPARDAFSRAAQAHRKERCVQQAALALLPLVAGALGLGPAPAPSGTGADSEA